MEGTVGVAIGTLAYSISSSKWFNILVETTENDCSTHIVIMNDFKRHMHLVLGVIFSTKGLRAMLEDNVH